MATCSNCDEPVPLRKSLDGRPLQKQDRECPNCGESLDGETDEGRVLRK